MLLVILHSCLVCRAECIPSCIPESQGRKNAVVPPDDVILTKRMAAHHKIFLLLALPDISLDSPRVLLRTCKIFSSSLKYILLTCAHFILISSGSLVINFKSFSFSRSRIVHSFSLACAIIFSTLFSGVTNYKSTQLTLRLLMSYIYGAPILDVSRSHTTTHHSR